MKPLKDTKIGQFLKSKGFNAVLDVAGTLVPGLSTLDKIKDAVLGEAPEVVLTEEDKQRFLELYKEELNELDMRLKDVQDARAREIAVNSSSTASWLSKNVAPIIALVYVAFSIALYILVLVGNIKTTDNITFLVIGNISGSISMLLGYYFGSSRTSSDKDKTIHSLAIK